MFPRPDGLELLAANVLCNCYRLNLFDDSFLAPKFSLSLHTSVWAISQGSDLDKSGFS